jgi:hypothetical protein
MIQHRLAALALAALTTFGSASAAGPGGPPPAPLPRGPGAPPPAPGPRIPSAEMLATVDGLDAGQQAEVRRILRERRDAEEALRARLRGEREALEQRERTERERIEDQSAQKLRATLGEDGYRAYARWAAQRGPAPLPPAPPIPPVAPVPPPGMGGERPDAPPPVATP